MDYITSKVFVIAVGIFVTLAIVTGVIFVFSSVYDVFGYVENTNTSIYDQYDNIYSMYGDTTLNTTTIGTDTDPKALTVTGASTFKNSVTLMGSATNLTVGGTTTSTGKITANGGITIATSLNYTGTKENCTGIYATLA